MRREQALRLAQLIVQIRDEGLEERVVHLLPLRQEADPCVPEQRVGACVSADRPGFTSVYAGVMHVLAALLYALDT